MRPALFGYVTVDFDAASYGVEVGLREPALNFDEISFGHFVGRVRKVLGKFAVGGENEQPFAVVVKPANGVNPAYAVAQNIHYRLATLVVGNCAKIALGLMQKVVFIFLYRNGPALHLYVVAVVHVVAEACGPAVYGDFALGYQPVAFAPAGNSALRQIFIYSHSIVLNYLLDYTI